MRTYNIEEAYRHITATFLGHWNDETNGWQSIDELDCEPRIKWPNVDDRDREKGKPEHDDQPWIRFYIQHRESEQATLGEINCRVFSREALLTLDIFVPTKTGLKLLLQLAKVCRRAFEGKRGIGDGSGIVFYRVRTPERETQRQRWCSISVLADVQYDEVL